MKAKCSCPQPRPNGIHSRVQEGSEHTVFPVLYYKMVRAAPESASLLWAGRT